MTLFIKKPAITRDTVRRMVREVPVNTVLREYVYAIAEDRVGSINQTTRLLISLIEEKESKDATQEKIQKTAKEEAEEVQTQEIKIMKGFNPHKRKRGRPPKKKVILPDAA